MNKICILLFLFKSFIMSYCDWSMLVVRHQQFALKAYSSWAIWLETW